MSELSPPSATTVLVTGGSGFVAIHCILQLLNAGYRVRTTVRSAPREADVRAMLKTGGCTETERLSFGRADLLADEGWAEATADCDYVLHVASPFPANVPQHEDELIRPAREGTLRVLRAARDAGVKRVVLTSSFAAMGYGHAPLGRPVEETDWTDVNGPHVSAYAKSKTLAERAAWNFISREGRGLELAVVNPVGIFGPALGADMSTSIALIQRILEGSVPGLPRIVTGLVDVRDVADLHLRAMTDPAARGERFLAVAEDFIDIPEITRILKSRLGPAAKRVPRFVIPDWAIRLIARFDPSVAVILSELGQRRNASNAKARRILNWTPRSNEEALIATAESLFQLGLLTR